MADTTTNTNTITLDRLCAVSSSDPFEKKQPVKVPASFASSNAPGELRALKDIEELRAAAKAAGSRLRATT